MEYELVCGQRELVWLRTEGYADVEITINGNTHEVRLWGTVGRRSVHVHS